MKRFIQVSILSLALAACTVGPDYRRPQTALPDDWNGAVSEDIDIAQWWHQFDDEELVRVIEESLAHNSELKVAAANADAAAAALRLARADYLPHVDAGVNVTRGRPGPANGQTLPGDVHTQYRGGLFSSYTLDIFGRVRRANEAALAELNADVAVREGVHAGIAAAVARTWFEGRALERRIALLERLHETRRDDLRLQQSRLDAGLISTYDFEQARAETAAVAARLPLLRAARQHTVTALAVLRGVSPQQMLREWSAERQRNAALDAGLPRAPSVPMDLPSALLERRPDIRAAEQRLRAANARIGEAKAMFFPQFSLTGFAGGVSAVFSELFESSARSWETGLGIVQPLTDINRVDARLGAAHARHAAARAAYEHTIQVAFEETLNALENVSAAREVMAAQRERVAALEAAYRVADARYRAGNIGYLDLLDVERQLRGVEQARVDAQLALLTATVDLYRALGGGWQQNLAVASRD